MTDLPALFAAALADLDPATLAVLGDALEEHAPPPSGPCVTRRTLTAAQRLRRRLTFWRRVKARLARALDAHELLLAAPWHKLAYQVHALGGTTGKVTASVDRRVLDDQDALLRAYLRRLAAEIGVDAPATQPKGADREQP